MIKSMTGYGRGDSSTDRMRFTVEIKSVNHRYNEVLVRIPREWLFVEEQIKKVVQSHLKRGRIDVFVNVHREEIQKKQLLVDWSLADAFITAGEEVQKRYMLEKEHRLGLKEILSLPDLIQLVEEDSELESQSSTLLKALDDAIERLLKMRLEEGTQLVIDLEQRLNTLHTDVQHISVRAPQVIKDARQRLQQKIIDGLPEGIAFDEGRLLTEVAIMAERGDISEELTRLASHIKQFRKMIEMSEPVGRQMDFLVQEMNREVNTIGSKAGDLEISQKVVIIKSELEKIREQVQNIE